MSPVMARADGVWVFRVLTLGQLGGGDGDLGAALRLPTGQQVGQHPSDLEDVVVGEPDPLCRIPGFPMRWWGLPSSAPGS